MSSYTKIDNYYIIENVITDVQINQLLEWFESIESTTTVTHGGDWDTSSTSIVRLECPYRTKSVIGVPYDTFPFMKEIFTNMFAAVIDSDFSLEGPPYLARYDVGDRHSTHVDKNDTWPNRHWLASIQLSDPNLYQGGDLYVDRSNGDFTVYGPRDKGCGIIYSGDLQHLVSPITQGSRYSLSESAG